MRNFLILVVCLLLFTTSWAQENILSEGDVAKFLKTWDPISKDLESLGQDYSQIQNPTMMRGYLGLDDVSRIFTKHGWGTEYIAKVSVIVGVTAMGIAEEAMNRMPEEQRASIKAYFDSMSAQLINGATEDDMEQVKAHMVDLKVVFENMN